MTLKKDIIAILVGLVIFIGLFGSIYNVTLTAPDNAVVYVDQGKQIYYAPPYIDNIVKASPGAYPSIDVEKLKASTLKEVQALNYTPDPVSQEKDYFIQRYRSFSSYLLEKLGIVQPLPSRWTPEGTWNW